MYPSLFISVHNHSNLSHAKYLANLAENGSKNEVSKQTYINLMKILIFQEVTELPISKSVCALVKGSYALCSLIRSQTMIAAGLLCLTQVLEM